MNGVQMTKKDLTREQIIRAAVRVFGENSFQNASISKIAREAKVAEGTIYQHFKNKEDLFFFIPLERTNTFCEGLELHLQGIHDAPGKITKFVWYFLHFFKNNPDYARMIMLEMRVSRGFLKTKGYSSLKRYTDLVLDTIKEGQEEGTIRNDISAFLLRQLLLGIVEHVIIRWLIKDEKGDPSENYAEIANLVLNGIRSKAPLEQPYYNGGGKKVIERSVSRSPAQASRQRKSLKRDRDHSSNTRIS
jgi:TetR/AcrR family transcriptional regulator, fatty acid metabolism regulator protein